MTASTGTASTATVTDTDIVRAVFQAFAGRVRSIDQFVGDPAAVATFWA